MSDSKSTDLIHHPYQAPGDFESPVVPVCKGSTVYFPTMAALRQRQWVDKSAYTYGLHGTPTTFTLEARLATLEGAQHVLLAPSGLSAITVVNMGLLKAGDTLLLPDNVYNPSKDFARHEMAAWGIGHRLYDAMQPESLAQALDETVKLVWLEAPGSVTGTPVEERVVALEQRAELFDALGTLTPADREMVALKFFAGLSNTEVAEATGYSSTNVGTRINRAMSRLRKALATGEEVAR